MYRTYTFLFRVGSPENGLVIFPMPRAPYVLLDQGDYMEKLAGKPWAEFLTKAMEYKKQVIAHPDLKWGTVLYGNVNGEAQICACHYDTSD